APLLASRRGRPARPRGQAVSCGSTLMPRSASRSARRRTRRPRGRRRSTFRPLLAFADRSEVAGGEGLAGLLRAGNAGSNTAKDHVTVLDMALAQVPEHARPRPGDPDSPRVLARSDSAGATHLFAAACRKRGVEFSFGFPIDERVQAIVDLIPQECWHPAIEAVDELRDGAWVAEATGMIDLGSWPDGSRLILRKERPHPGAQLTFTRRRRAPHHRLPHRHPTRGDPGPGGRAGVAAPPARPGRGPHPRRQASRPAQLPLPAPPGAAAAISSVQAAISHAISTANSDIDQANAVDAQAYAITNNMATGACSGDGLGNPPPPVAHIH